MSLTAASALLTVPRTGTWFRAVLPQYYPASIVNLAYTTQYASRFYEGRIASVPYQTLYLAPALETALREVEVLYGPSSNPLSNLEAVTLFNFEVQLSRLVDLTNPVVQSSLQTNIQELTGDWRVFATLAALNPGVSPAPVAPTHQLGAALFAAGYEGLLTRSAKVPTATTLVIFPQNLLSGSYIRHIDPHTRLVYQL